MAGLNLIGTFNEENRTVFEADGGEEEEVAAPDGPEDMEEGEMDEEGGTQT